MRLDPSTWQVSYPDRLAHVYFRMIARGQVQRVIDRCSGWCFDHVGKYPGRRGVDGTWMSPRVPLCLDPWKEELSDGFYGCTK
jgi:hypothetical protein